ncbi:hypothetical protein D9757_003557 [Collybiopsis confluens]|uniref:Uncharacterized protein n=1 Tax=Collybiopsis confluens TaxID=2823264 RepID=A0A8H5HUS8_9AGAR|nr:hypothetical protein D9757_003557 [Collybiopsis confluens]
MDLHPERPAKQFQTLTLAKVDVAAQFVTEADGDTELDPQVAKKILRKIDLHIMPFMCLMYLQDYPRTIGGIGDTVNCSSVSEPVQLAELGILLDISRFRVPPELSSSTVSSRQMDEHQYFYLGSSAHASISFYDALHRSLIPVPALVPGCMLRVILSEITSMFYTRQEQNKRVGYWFLMNGFAVMFLGFVSFGLLHTKTHNFAPWQWYVGYISSRTNALPLMTLALGQVDGYLRAYHSRDLSLLLVLVPGFPHECMVLESGRAYSRCEAHKGESNWLVYLPDPKAKNSHSLTVLKKGIENKHWKREQFIETFRDPKIWVMVLFSAISNIPNSLTNQRQLIVSQFGFTPIETTLLGCVDGAVEILSIWLGISLAGVKGIGRAYAGIIIYIPGLFGALLVNLLPSHMKVGLLFGYWLSIFAIAPFAIFLGWVSGLVSGHTKRTTTNAMVLIGYAISNFASPFIWKKMYQPRNRVPWDFLSASIGASVLILLILRAMLANENARRDNATLYHDVYDDVYLESKSTADTSTERVKIDKAFLDLTDIQNQDFRYTL